MSRPVHAEVRVENGNIERAISKLAKKLKKIGLMEQLRERRYYVKPSVTRRLKKKRKERLSKKQNERT